MSYHKNGHKNGRRLFAENEANKDSIKRTALSGINIGGLWEDFKTALKAPPSKLPPVVANFISPPGGFRPTPMPADMTLIPPTAVAVPPMRLPARPSYPLVPQSPVAQQSLVAEIAFGFGGATVGRALWKKQPYAGMVVGGLAGGLLGRLLNR